MEREKNNTDFPNPLGPCLGFSICEDKSDLDFCDGVFNSSISKYSIPGPYDGDTYQCEELCKVNNESKYKFKQCINHEFDKREN